MKYVGEIVDICDDDPDQKLKVMVYGVYDDISQDDIPWAFPCTHDNGSRFIPFSIGDLVYVTFNDGDDIYHPIYEGYVKSDDILKSILNKHGMNGLNVLTSDGNFSIIRSDKEGFILENDGSSVKLTSDGAISIQNKSGQSEMVMDGGEFLVTSLLSQLKSNDVKLGNTPTFSATRAEVLYPIMLALATKIDILLPPVPPNPSMVSLVEGVKSGMKSSSVKIS